jgi:predicted membrane protein
MDYLTINGNLMNTRKLALLTILTALCLVVQIIPRPPNVEFTSFVSFVIGLMEGAVIGAFFGSFVMLVNGFVSPWGFGGLNIPFQMGGMIIAGALGGVYRRFTHNISFSARFSLEAAVLGASIALVYDLITNLGYGLQLILAGEGSSLALFTTVAYGSFFSLAHILSNTAVFGVLFLPLTKALSSLKVGESPWSKKELMYS